MTEVKPWDSAIASGFKPDQYSDLILRCTDASGGVRDFHVYKMVVCTQSGFFANAVEKSVFLEGETGIVNMTDDTLEAVYVLLRHLYGRDDISKPQHFSDNDATKQALILALEVFALADRLQIISPRERAGARVHRTTAHCWKDDDFVIHIQNAFSVAPPDPSGDALRHSILLVCFNVIQELLKSKDFVDMLELNGEMGKALTMVLADHLRKARLELKVEKARHARLEALTCPQCEVCIWLDLDQGVIREEPGVGGHAAYKNFYCPTCGARSHLSSWRGKKQWLGREDDNVEITTRGHGRGRGQGCGDAYGTGRGQVKIRYWRG
ncbi:hypothetical protein EJ08DRAFT_678395 [Tothia fuscella]|uniref:BTB domain-containing protein n=1 Tax=Tothia fuscella TaxID=1048955 RepID=A0A9P4NSI8_9PEZI|nr:hypothetical protein EJ08DRAFT_678395 [Tothia fuscella]